MKNGRQFPSALSTLSSHTYDSERTRAKNRSSRHSMDHSEGPIRKSKSRMKFIIAVGIALPIVAAVIGVVAWTVSADSAFRGPSSSELRRSDTTAGSNEEDIFQVLEDRHDVMYTSHSSPQPQRYVPSTLNEESKNRIFDDNTEKDPLYIVHFVPSPKPSKVEASTNGPNTVSTVSSEVLQKILSASKGSKPGTPQFVVFAPIPSAEDHKDKADDLTSMGASSLNFLSKPPIHKTEMDYDYEEELRKYQELIDSKDNNNLQDTPTTVNTSKSHLQKIHVVTQNYSSGSLFQNMQPQQARSAGSNIGLLHSEFNQHNQRIHSPTVPQTQSTAPVYIGKEYQQQSHNRQEENFNQPQQVYLPQQATNYQLQRSLPEQVPKYQHPPLTQAANYQLQQPFPDQQHHLMPQGQGANYQPQPPAVERSGQYEPIGIKLSLGNGGEHKGLLGGGYSPLGIISSILPVIRKPRVSLNGKLMFGVMLEKGVKFGDNHGH